MGVRDIRYIYTWYSMILYLYNKYSTVHIKSNNLDNFLSVYQTKYLLCTPEPSCLFSAASIQNSARSFEDLFTLKTVEYIHVECNVKKKLVFSVENVLFKKCFNGLSWGSECKRQKMLAGFWQTMMKIYLGQKIDRKISDIYCSTCYLLYVCIFTFGRHHNGGYGNVEPAQTSADDQNPAQHKH